MGILLEHFAEMRPCSLQWWQCGQNTASNAGGLSGRPGLVSPDFILPTLSDSSLIHGLKHSPPPNGQVDDALSHDFLESSTFGCR